MVVIFVYQLTVSIYFQIFFLFLQKLGRDGAVPLSNSLSLADRHRISSLVTKNRGKDVQELCPFKYGNNTLLIHLVTKDCYVLKDVLV